MRRREFIALASSSALIWSKGTAAQQTSPVVGFLAPMARDTVAFQAAAFRKGLAEAGFTDGSNLLIDYRWADHQVSRVPALAAELVSRPVRVIAAFTTVAARAAKAATQTIPVVFVTGDDPVAAGLATSLSRPAPLALKSALGCILGRWNGRNRMYLASRFISLLALWTRRVRARWSYPGL